MEFSSRLRAWSCLSPQVRARGQAMVRGHGPGGVDALAWQPGSRGNPLCRSGTAPAGTHLVFVDAQLGEQE
jgi:hypothetical protein